MKRLLLTLTLSLPILAFAGGGPTITSGIFPQVVEGSTPTNNNRVVCWFWMTISGLTPNATYHYYTALDSLNAAAGSNGAGNPVLINQTTRELRRITNPAMTANTGYDSLTANSNGQYSGWFAVEPTGNSRFVPGNFVCARIMLNNGAGGTTVANRLSANSDPIKVINFGTTAASTTQGSAVWDSLDAAPKNFICVYDNVSATGRPVNIAIVENDSLYLKQFSSTATFYRNGVDSLDFHWGAIIPNDLANGIRALEERDFTSGNIIDLVTDADGIWCSGLNTVNPGWGNTGMFLNSTFVLSASAVIPDTTWTSQLTFFSASSNDPNATITWDFGDASTGTGANPTHTYANPGTVQVQVIINTGGCSDTIYHTVVVELGTFIPMVPTLWFGVTPNPTDGEFFISTKDNNEKSVTVFNVIGETVLVQNMNGNSLLLNLDGQQPGIYFIRVKDEITGRTGMKKVVLQ